MEKIVSSGLKVDFYIHSYNFITKDSENILSNSKLENLLTLITELFVFSCMILEILAELLGGVKMAILTWTIVLMPIKQSASVMITLFAGMRYTILQFTGSMLLPDGHLVFSDTFYKRMKFE